MIILTAQQMRQAEADAYRAGLSYLRMMDNAGSAAAKWIGQKFSHLAGPVAVVCGAGNNGGDGFVVARRLAEKGVATWVILACGQPESVTAKEMYDRLVPAGVKIVDAKTQGSFARQLLAESKLVVDGVFGTGFHGQLPAMVKELLGYCRRLKKPVAALDLPSGVNADTGQVAEGTPECVGTVTFHSYKFAHVLYPAAGYCGQVHLADIGLPADPRPHPFVIDRAWVADRLTRPSGDTHKGTFGKAALLVGSKGMSGAAGLAVSACLRCGVGLAVPVVPDSIYPLVAAVAPEGVYRVYDQNTSPGRVAQLAMEADALLAGCGLGDTPFTKAVCRELAVSYPGSLILDADGINSLVSHKDVLRTREGETVFTPHPGEMARLLGTDIPYIQSHRFEAAAAFAQEYGAVTVLKGAGTVIAAPDGRVAVNCTGNSGLSKGGSGDVLAGMVASLCAQGLSGFDAACAGVWLHGRAGELASKRLSRRAMLPTDVVDQLPSLFLQFEE